MPSRLLTLLAVLVAYVPAPCDGFLSSGKYVCANVSDVLGAESQFGFLSSVPLPHESCDVRGDHPLRASRPSSWPPAYVFNSDEFPTCTQGAAFSAFAWDRGLFHNAGPLCPHGICVSPDSDWPAASDYVDDLPLNQHVPLGGHTPAPRPTSSSSSTALTIPPRMDVMFVRPRIAAFMDAVIFLHRGALDGCFDFERRPPRSPSSDEGRERRLARRIRSWCRNEGSRIARCRRTREVQSGFQSVLDSRWAYQQSRQVWQQRAEFILSHVPAYVSSITAWAIRVLPHRLAIMASAFASAVTRSISSTLFTVCNCYSEAVLDAVTAKCKTAVYFAMRGSLEWFIDELLLPSWVSAREGVSDVLQKLSFLAVFIIALAGIALVAGFNFPYRVACTLTVFLVACFATMQYIILSYFSIDPTIVAVVSIAAVFWLVASPLQRRAFCTRLRAVRPLASPLQCRAVCTRLRAVRPLVFLAFLQAAAAAGADDAMKCPTFDGTSMSWTQWIIAFTAWVAWKEPRLIDFLTQGDSSCPTPANWLNPTPDEVTEVEKWNLLNVRLYGSILMHMSEPLRVSLHTASPVNGCGAVEYLRRRFGAHSSGDRTEATARMQRSFIDPRAPMSTDDLALQYNEISQAVADLVTSGGDKPDGKYLISLFENSLPASYAQVRQMLRYQKHDEFEVYYQDMLEQVKAEVKSSSQVPLGAFAVRQPRDGGRGSGLGLGANPCFNCGSTTHTRDRCPEPRVKCEHCGGGHMSSLCPKGPGGALRDSLSTTAKRALSRSVEVNDSDGDEKGGAHSAQSATLSYAATPDEALVAQFRAYRAGKAARSSPAAATFSAPPATRAISAQGLIEPDEMEEFMSAIGLH